MTASSLCPHMAERELESSGSLPLLIRIQIPSWGPYPHDFTYLPKAPPLNAITWRGWDFNMNRGPGTDIQFIMDSFIQMIRNGAIINVRAVLMLINKINGTGLYSDGNSCMVFLTHPACLPPKAWMSLSADCADHSRNRPRCWGRVIGLCADNMHFC